MGYAVRQGWPKCGPPKIFCGPPKIFCGPSVKFWIHNYAIYDAFMYEITLNLNKLCDLYIRKNN